MKPFSFIRSMDVRLQDSSDNVEVINVSFKRANHCFRDFKKHHYSNNSNNSFFWETIYANYTTEKDNNADVQNYNLFLSFSFY